MAGDNSEIVRRTCELWSRGELDQALALIAPDAVWQPSGRFIGSGEIYRGHEGVRKFWALFREPWTSVSLEPVETVYEDESRLVTRTKFHAVGRASGVTTETELFVLWTVRDSLVTGYRSFATREEAVQEATTAARSSAGAS